MFRKTQTPSFPLHRSSMIKVLNKLHNKNFVELNQIFLIITNKYYI